jgi:hypothetical protein
VGWVADQNVQADSDIGDRQSMKVSEGIPEQCCRPAKTAVGVADE